jgi:hypothetical protein
VHVVCSLIRYTIGEPSEEWEREVLAFIRAIDCDASLRGRVSYRCLKETDGVSFCHIAVAVDDTAVEELKQKPFFKPYSIRLRAVANAGPHFTNLRIVGGTEVQL